MFSPSFACFTILTDFDTYRDKLGFLVWSEMGNAYNYSAEAVAAFIPEWTECMERDISHPCIVGYVPINEVIPFLSELSM